MKELQGQVSEVFTSSDKNRQLEPVSILETCGSVLTVEKSSDCLK
jgi:hypothetical protein